MQEKYFNKISNSKTIYPFRFKTEKEFIEDYGTRWWNHVCWTGSDGMDYLFGTDFKISPEIDDIIKLFMNSSITYQNKDYIVYYNDVNRWDICALMITNNKKLDFKILYANNRQNIYEADVNSDELSSDIFYRFKDDDDKERILDLLEKEGFIRSRIGGYDAVVVVSFYNIQSPEHVKNKKDLYGFRNIDDNEIIRLNKVYNGGDYIFAHNYDELLYYIKLKQNNVANIINKRKNIYESIDNNESFDIFYRPKNEQEYKESLELLYKNEFKWDNGSNYDTEFQYVKCLIISFSDKLLYKYDDEYSDEFIIEDNIDSNDGNYIFANNIDELKYQIYSKKSEFYKYMNKRKNIYENTKIIKYSDFENLEYRKGSKEYGGIITKLLEFLRLYDTQEDLTFKIDDFVKKSNITIEEIKKLLHSKEQGQKLYDFEIVLDKDNIIFKNLNKTGKNRPFESNNN